MRVQILSFEGPDAYARAGGLATRVMGLAAALAAAGCDSHLRLSRLPRRRVRVSVRTAPRILADHQPLRRFRGRK